MALRSDSAATGRSQLADQLRALGVRQGASLLVHTSYRAVRPVAAGPATLVRALLDAVGSEGTVVMPSWGDEDGTLFDPAFTRVSPTLGVTAELFRRFPGARRSAHPFAFAALGPEAEAITSDPLPIPPHRLESPVGRVYERGGQVLLLGVGHDANTTIHLAEVLAGVPYALRKHCTVLEGGRGVRMDYRENDHCCERFALADEWMRERGLQREGRVGAAQARLMEARDLVAVVREHLVADPLIFLHGPEHGCAECDEARRSVP
jgi:aminoglycoside N3'-acetyltransferase